MQQLYRSNEHNGNNDIYFPLKLWAWSYKILNLFYFFNSMNSENISRSDRNLIGQKYIFQDSIKVLSTLRLLWICWHFFWIGFNLKSQFNNYISLFFSLLDNDLRKMNYHPCKCLNHGSASLSIATNQACEKSLHFPTFELPYWNGICF